MSGKTSNNWHSNAYVSVQQFHDENPKILLWIRSATGHLDDTDELAYLNAINHRNFNKLLTSNGLDKIQSRKYKIQMPACSIRWCTRRTSNFDTTAITTKCKKLFLTCSWGQKWVLLVNDRSYSHDYHSQRQPETLRIHKNTTRSSGRLTNFMQR